MSTTNTTSTACKFYFCHTDEDFLPIVGTMFSKTNNAKSDCHKHTAYLPATQMTVPAGSVQCFHPNHLRYFYRVNPVSGQVIPNSLFSQKGKPANMCGIREYLIYKKK